LRIVIEEEIQAIEKNKYMEASHTLTLPTNKKTIDVKWVYKIKRDANGLINRYKTRLVAKGYKQKYDIDYDEVFAPVARLDIVRMLISLATYQGWKLHQLDVKLAFLNGVLEEKVYVKQPEGFIVKGA
jgi:Reverse transcriptase (RNA-dependent DNA polymerase)